MPLLTLIRHGQSTYNLENRFTGNLDVELTAFGEEEARVAAGKLNGIHYAFAYTSMLRRAQDTLRIILKEMRNDQLAVIKNPAFDERAYGSLQGLNKVETIIKCGADQVELWRRSYSVRPPGGESLEDTFNRTVPYYRMEVEPKLRDQKNILIVAHGNSLRALMMYLESIDQDTIATVNIPTGSPRNYTIDENLKIIHTDYMK